MFQACLPGGRFPATTLLSNLAIDHLLRADSRPIERRPREILESVAAKDFLDARGDLVEWTGRLGAVKMTRLDTSTGTLKLDVDEEQRRFASAMDVGGASWDVEFTLPARVEGGYWRTPAVLQVAFWKGSRVAVKASGPGVDVVAEIECAVFAVDGVRLVTADAAVPDILVSFGGCP